MRILLIIILVILVSCEGKVDRIKKVKEPKKREYKGKVKRIIEYDCQQYWANRTPIRIAKESCKIYRIMDFNSDEILIKETAGKSDYYQMGEVIKYAKVNEEGSLIVRY